jgi:hypothetical protein
MGMRLLRRFFGGRRLRTAGVLAAGVAIGAAGFAVASVVPVFGQTSSPTFSACLNGKASIYNVTLSPATPLPCKGSDQTVTWSQTGPQGQPGTPGAPGNGFNFTTASGTTGPTLSQAGTYFVVMEAEIDNLSGSPQDGKCVVVARNGFSTISNFNGAFNVGPNQDSTFSFSGMFVIPAAGAPATAGTFCSDGSDNPITTSNVRWWVSPVG